MAGGGFTVGWFCAGIGDLCTLSTLLWDFAYGLGVVKTEYAAHEIW